MADEHDCLEELRDQILQMRPDATSGYFALHWTSGGRVIAFQSAVEPGLLDTEPRPSDP